MIYENLRKVREENGFSQRDIAEKLGVKQQQYQRWETGKVEMPIKVFIKLAKIYNVSIDYLVAENL